MSKDPAFLFYSSDFLTGTMFLSNEQVGLYIRMLCAQHQHEGRINTNVLRTECERIAGGDAVLAKFKHDANGSYNKRLEIEMEKRKNKGIKARQSANKRWESKPKKQECESNANAMRFEDVNENENKDKNILEGGVGGDFNWESVKQYFLNADEWMYKFCTSKAVSRETLVPIMSEFLNEMELRNEYKNLKELQRHFTNWYNIKKKKNENYFDRFSKATRGAHELLEELRAESKANFGSNEPNSFEGNDTYPAIQ